MSVPNRGATVVVKSQAGLMLERPAFELVEVLNQKKHRFEASRVRVGAGIGNDLLVEHPTVSSVHLEIEASPQGFRVVDLDSTNGVRVNGVRVKDALLDDGAKLSVGEVELFFRVLNDKVSLPISERDEFHGVVGAAPSMRAIFSRIERVAKTDATVLIRGETGTGKEVVAWSIYEASKRAEKPFVVVDCGAVARTLIESELFGHEKGAFTGAEKRRIGAFERAHGGTLFLDELGELEKDLQPKLLRALERKEIQRLGGDATIPVDVRIIAATNRDLRAMVARGEFREDLYYRLAVVSLEVPALRERKEDIPALVDHFLHTLGATRAELPADAMQRFMEHRWPGNCRELKNAVERMVVLGDTRENSADGILASSATSPSSAPTMTTPPTTATLSPASLSAAFASSPGPSSDVSSLSPFTIDASKPYKDQKASVISDFEERYARHLMKLHKGNVSSAARQAGIDRMSLHKILDRYGLDARDLART